MSAQYTMEISATLNNLNLSPSLSQSTRSMISQEKSQIRALTSRLAPLDVADQSYVECLFSEKPLFGDSRSVLCWLRSTRKALASAVAFNAYKQAVVECNAERRQHQFMF